jgi:type II secretory pathway component GspD/PulD (secretin)
MPARGRQGLFRCGRAHAQCAALAVRAARAGRAGTSGTRVGRAFCVALAAGLLNAPVCAQNHEPDTPEFGPPSPPAQPAEAGEVLVAGQIDLARLVDLASTRLDLNIEYDASLLKGTVTLRLGSAITDAELWTLVNQLLASRGFTTVRGAGGTLSVVKLAEAAGLSPLERDGAASSGEPGFVTSVVRVQHRPLKEVVEALAAVLSPSGAKPQAIGTSLILISDLSARVDRALDLVARLDTPDAAVALEPIAVVNLGAPAMATLVGQVRAKAEAAGGRPLQGDVLPSPDGTSVLVLAPSEQLPAWRALIAGLDQRPSVETRTYGPGSFTATEVGALIEQSVRAGLAAPQADGWRLVIEELTGSIVLSARPEQHAQVDALMARLAALPAGSRRPVRTFVVRNRSVTDILGVLQQLIGAGVLDAADAADGDPAQPANPADGLAPAAAPGGPAKNGESALSQRTERPVPPSGPTSTPPSQSWALAPRASQSRPTDGAPITLTADEGTSTIIAVGEPRLLAQVETLVRQLDIRQPQVMLEVMLVSLTDGQTLDLGVEIEKLEFGTDAAVRLASLFGLSIPTAGGGRTTGQARGFSGVVLDPGDFAVVVRALETINDGRSLSRPRLLVNNGQQAVFNSVLEEPFVSTNASDTVATTSFGGTQNAGTTVSMRPQIAEADHLVLEYSISLSTFVGDSTNPALPPPRQQNQVQSVATIPDGYTVVVGGLETSTSGNSVEQVPLIAQVPILGELFKSRSKSASRTRFFVFLRANVMRGESFESLKYASDQSKQEAALSDGWPEVEPVVMD